jgi:DNA-directed RNA polymerase
LISGRRFDKLFRTASVVRTKDTPEQALYLRQAGNRGQLDEIYRALNVLGATPWAVNEDIFRVVTEVWNSGEAIAAIPVKDPLVTIKDPEKPADYAERPRTARGTDRWKTMLRETALKRKSAHSDRCNINYQLEIARAVRIMARARLDLVVTRRLNVSGSIVPRRNFLLPSQPRLPWSGVPDSASPFPHR